MEDLNVQLTRDALTNEAKRRRALADKLLKEPEHGIDDGEIVALLRTANIMEEVAEGPIQLGHVAHDIKIRVDGVDEIFDPSFDLNGQGDEVALVDILQDNAKDETDLLVPVVPNPKPKTVKRRAGRPRKGVLK